MSRAGRAQPGLDAALTQEDDLSWRALTKQLQGVHLGWAFVESCRRTQTCIWWVGMWRARESFGPSSSHHHCVGSSAAAQPPPSGGQKNPQQSIIRISNHYDSDTAMSEEDLKKPI